MVQGALHDGVEYFISWIVMLHLILLNSDESSRSEFLTHLKAFESAKHYLKLSSKRSQDNCPCGVIKEGNERKTKMMHKPSTIQTATMNAGEIVT